MAELIARVISCPSKTAQVLDAWVAGGVSGVTCLESKGLAHFAEAHGVRDDVPLFPSLRNLLPQPQEPYSTLLAVVPDGFDVAALAAATERITGRFDAPNTGILFVLPVTKVWGLKAGERERNGHPAD